MATHLVTGGTGFVGTAVTKVLLSEGEKVRVFDINEPKERLNNVEYLIGDICNKYLVEQSLTDVDYVHHNAVYVPLGGKTKKVWDVNVGGLKNILKISKKNNIKKVIIMSSSSVYGNKVKQPITRKTPFSPTDLYGESRLEAERIAKSFASDDLDIIIFRPHIIAGAERSGIFSYLFQRILTEKTLWLPDSVKYKHQVIHVDDLAKACWQAVKYSKTESYNIGTDTHFTVKEVLEELISRQKANSQIRLIPRRLVDMIKIVDKVLKLSVLGPNRILMGAGFHSNCTYVKEKLNWTPRYNDYDIWIEAFDWYAGNCKNYEN